MMQPKEDYKLKVIDIQLDKAELLKLPEDELSLFLSLGHAVNEINAFSKVLYWSANGLKRNQAEERGQISLLLIFMQVLAGEINESWELFKNKFNGSRLSKKYTSHLSDETQSKLKELKKYFGTTNACTKIRNNYAFHFSKMDLSKVLPIISDELHVYLERDKAPNNLFALSELILSKAITIDLIDNKTSTDSINNLVGELFEIGSNIIQVIDEILYVIIEYNNLELRLNVPTEVQFDALPSFDSVALTWFTDTSDSNCY